MNVSVECTACGEEFEGEDFDSIRDDLRDHLEGHAGGDAP